jgi:hypothetical protein
VSTAAAVANPLAINLRLQPKQQVAFTSPATEILYGGAAGGGKSHLMRVAAIYWAAQFPGIQIYLFRRTWPDLFKNHMTGPTSFPALLAPWVNAGHADIKESKGYIEIGGKSRIHLCHCELEKDVYKYQGADIHVLLIDELTHFTATQYRFLRSRVRAVGLNIPEQYRRQFPRILSGSNPGNVGHNWVKAMLVDPKPPGVIWRAPADDGGMLRQYIQARLADNPALLADNPDYINQLKGLGNPALVRAMLEGDWNIVAGGAFDDLWNPDRHVIRPFQIPETWTLFRSFDWGSTKPHATVWLAECNGEYLEDTPRIPKSSLVTFAELYGWNGTPNTGTKELAIEVGRKVVALDRSLPIRQRVIPGPADPAIYAVENGSSIAADMERAGCAWVPAEAGPGSRKAGLEALRKRLKAALEGDEPGLFFFDTCRQVIRTLPVLPRSQRDPDDVDTAAEDHLYDALRYGVSNPFGKPNWRGGRRAA